MMDNKKCGVCGGSQGVELAESVICTMLLPYCSECLILGAEPYGMLVELLALIGEDWEIECRLHWLSDVVQTTLKATNTPIGTLRRDVREAEEKRKSELKA